MEATVTTIVFRRNSLVTAVRDAAARIALGLMVVGVTIPLGVVIGLFGDGSAQAQMFRTEVPAAGRVSPAVVNYTRVRPTIATAGLLKEGAVTELKSLGFVSIIDLRGPEEGTAGEKRSAEAAGLAYVNIPVTNAPPTEEQIAEFARIVENEKGHPLMVHCASGNRVGAMWTLYRVKKTGASFAQAAAEGRAIGMQPAREAAVREQLGELARD